MATPQNKVIHRFVRPISDYEEGGLYYNRIIPLDAQAYAFYTASDNSNKEGLYYVLGDGNHTYAEIRAGLGSVESAKEYIALTSEFVDNLISSFEERIKDLENTINNISQ